MQAGISGLRWAGSWTPQWGQYSAVWDYGHLTVAGAKYVAEGIFEPIVRDIARQ
jgi:lysophospholipase L1-like esterase